MTPRVTVRWLARIACLFACNVSLVERAHATDRPDISEELRTGRLSAAEDSLTEHLSNEPKDELARFQLGAVQYFAADIDHVVSDVFDGTCHYPGVDEGSEPVFEGVYFDHTPVVCALSE